MITNEEFDYAQKLLGAKGRPRTTPHNFAYGSMWCAVEYATVKSSLRLLPSLLRGPTSLQPIFTITAHVKALADRVIKISIQTRAL